MHPGQLVSLPDHDLGVLFVQLASLLVTARVLGLLARRLGQPAVIGQLVAGLLLGPSVFGRLWPAGFHWFLPGSRPEGSALTSISELALVVLLAVIGAETDLRLIGRLGGAAASVSVSSLVIPLAAGAVLALYLPHQLWGPHAGRATFALLMAGALAVSSLPVIAKIVTDLGMARRNFGQLIFAAGTANDVVGFLLVAVATALAASSGSGSSHLIRVGVSLAVLVVASFTVGQRVVDRLLRSVLAEGSSLSSGLGLWLMGALVLSAAFQTAGIEGALGAFLFGLLLGRSRYREEKATRVLAASSAGFFAPVYFATAGLRADASVLGRPSLLLAFLALVVVGAGSKFAGAALGAALARLPRREWLALGIGLNGRGALQVILSTAGLSAGILSSTAFTVIVLLSIVTSLATPPLLRAVASDWAGTDEEQERLGHESEMERNVVVKTERVLIPSRGSANSIVAAEVVAAVWPEDSPVTLLTIGTDGQGMGAMEPAEAVLAPRTVERRQIPSDDVLERILDEGRLGYGVVVVGAADSPVPGGLLSPVVDDLLARSPLPTVVVRRARRAEGRLPSAFAKALVAVAGTASSRAAQEVAFRLGRNLGTQLVAVHVVNRVSRRFVSPSRSGAHAGRDVLVDAARHGEDVGVGVRTVSRQGSFPGEEILAVAAEEEVDVLVIGATARSMEGRPFLGHTVEHVLENAECTVVVVVVPDPALTPVGIEEAVAAAE